MKVALLLSGLARKVKEGKDQYFGHIIDSYDTDVYLQYWEDSKYSEYEIVHQVYSPKKFIADKPFSFKEYMIGVESPNDPMSRPMAPYDIYGNYTSYPAFYAWQKVYSLLEGNYDCIIMSRYDIGWPDAIDLYRIDMSKINIAAMHWPGSHIPDNNIVITNQELANRLFTDFFECLVKVTKADKKIGAGEHNFLRILQEKYLDRYIFKSNNINFNLLRDFKVWY